MTTVVLVDDHELVREAIAGLLDEEPDLRIIGQGGRGRDALTLCEERQPDVLLLDYSLPDLDALEVTRQLDAKDLPTAIVVLTMHDNEDMARRVLHAGAIGFVTKDAPPEELAEAIRAAQQGRRHVSRRVMQKMIDNIGALDDSVPERSLSNRELEVLVKIANGGTSSSIADELCLSVSTIETYRARLKQKLQLETTSDIVRFAIRRGLTTA